MAAMALANFGREARLICTKIQEIQGTISIARTCSNSTTSANYRRGPGGRSSFGGQLVTVFGCTGLLGRDTVSRLGAMGHQVMCPSHRQNLIQDFKMMGDLGQILYQQYSLRDKQSIYDALKYSTTAINCVGTWKNTWSFNHWEVNVDAAQDFARAAKEMGVETFIHISHLNASHNPPGVGYFVEDYERLGKIGTFTSNMKNFPEGGYSEYLMAKAEAEERVREEFPEAIILRVAPMYGIYADDFMSYFKLGELRTVNGRRIPLWEGGNATTKRPVYRRDVVSAIRYAVENHKDCAGKTYEIYGPERYTLGDLVGFAIRCADSNRLNTCRVTGDIDLFIESNPVVQQSFRSYTWGYEYLTYMNHEDQRVLAPRAILEYTTDVVRGLPNLKDLGVPTPAKLTDVYPVLVKPANMLRVTGDPMPWRGKRQLPMPRPLPEPAIAPY